MAIIGGVRRRTRETPYTVPGGGAGDPYLQEQLARQSPEEPEAPNLPSAPQVAFAPGQRTVGVAGAVAGQPQGGGYQPRVPSYRRQADVYQQAALRSNALNALRRQGIQQQRGNGQMATVFGAQADMLSQDAGYGQNFNFNRSLATSADNRANSVAGGYTNRLNGEANVYNAQAQHLIPAQGGLYTAQAGAVRGQDQRDEQMAPILRQGQQLENDLHAGLNPKLINGADLQNARLLDQSRNERTLVDAQAGLYGAQAHALQAPAPQYTPSVEEMSTLYPSYDQYLASRGGSDPNGTMMGDYTRDLSTARRNLAGGQVPQTAAGSQKKKPKGYPGAG
jgi:hypothetical protein